MKITKEHQCDMCDEKSYFLKLAQPTPVRVEGEKPFMALAEYAMISLNRYTHPESGDVINQVAVMVADADEKSYPGMIYGTNQERTLEEVVWIIGGEYNPEFTLGVDNK